MPGQINPTVPTAGTAEGTAESQVSAALTSLVAEVNDRDYALTTYRSVDGVAASLVNARPSVTPGSLGTPTYIDPADRSVPGRAVKYRLRAYLGINQVAPGTTITFGLYPATLSAGGSNFTNTYTLGTVVAGSTVAFVNPSASSANHADSGDFTAPTAGLYILGWVSSGSLPAGTTADYATALQFRQV